MKNERMKKIIIPVVILVIGLLGGASWYFFGQKQTSKYTGSIERVTVAAYPDYAPFVYLAKEKGFFKDAGLDVTIKTFEAGRLAMNALENGEADIATAADFVFANDSFSQSDIRIFSTVTMSDNTHELVARKGRGIEKIADIKGKKVAATKKSSGEFLLGDLLVANNLTLGDIEMVNLTPSEIVNAFEEGDIDVALTWEPSVYKLKRILGHDGMSFPAQGGRDLYFLFISNQGYIDKNPDVLKKFVTGMIRAEQFVVSHPAETEDFVKVEFRHDSGYLKSAWHKFNITIGLPQALLLVLDDQARWILANKLTTAEKIPNYLNFMYFDALEKVKSEAVTIIHN